MPGDDDATEHKGQLPPFTPPKYNWNQDNLYEQFKSFKRVVEAYPIYNNLSISEDDKKDPSKLLDAFEHYFKPECNIFQSWYALGSIYSGAFKTQSEFYHKLNSVANDCSFTNKDEIVKFLYLTHN